MSSTVAPCPVTAVYSLLREPSLALLWTHGYTFHVRSPSHAGNITWDNLARLRARKEAGDDMIGDGKDPGLDRGRMDDSCTMPAP